MRYIFLIVSIVVFAFAQTESLPQPQTKEAICEQAFKLGDVKLIAESGCCSWHQGVCGCRGGRVTCCDGSTSPSCTCKGEDIILDPNSGIKN